MINSGISRNKRKIKEENVTGFIFGIVPVVGFVLFGLIPLLIAVYMSFMKLDGFRLTGQFVKFNNYIEVIKDPVFWQSVKSTIILTLSLLISLALALILAVLMQAKIKGQKFFRAVYFMPFICSVVAITAMWNWLLDYNFGIVNQLLGININWKNDVDWYLPALMIMIVWSTTGYKTLLLSVALHNVNRSYYEAAEIDGANSLQKFIKITLPSISPTMFFLLVTGFINALQEFSRSQVWSSSGGPNGKGITVVFYLYRNAFEYFDMGVAAATSWLLTAVILVITFINFKVSKKWVSYD